MARTLSKSIRYLLGELQAVSNIRGDQAAVSQKLDLLKQIQQKEINASYLLNRLHALLLYLRAFPDNQAIFQTSNHMLEDFHRRIDRLSEDNRQALDDSGIAGTNVNYEYSYISAIWLAEEFPEHVNIDWDAYHSPEKLDELLQLFINRAEQQIFDDAVLHTEEWIKLAKGSSAGSELSWLFMQCVDTGPTEKLVEQIYNAAEVPVIWSLDDGYGSRTHNRLAGQKTVYRKTQMRRPPVNVKKEIVRPMRSIIHLSPEQARPVVNSVKATLLVRNREVYAMQYPNLAEVYLASAGEGAQIVFLGVQPDRRLNLEANYGYVIYSNGTPIGYGGVTPLFRQGNTGINIFDEYRKGESAFLYVQVLRMAYSLFGCTRFVVNPYQFGADNNEALQSGAFWFYYRLGFRPADRENRKLAEKEFGRLQRSRRYRTPLARLKSLATSDLHLVLPGERDHHYFSEEWLGGLAAAATHLIAGHGITKRYSALSDISRDIRKKLGIKSIRAWNEHEREAFVHLAPVVGLIRDLDRWSGSEKRKLVDIIRAKGGPAERQYARLIYRHDRLRETLKRLCAR